MDVVVIEYDGGIEEFPVLIQTVDNLVADGCRRVVIDLQPLPFINSAALGYLIRVSKSLKACGGQLALARVQPAIRNLIQMANLAPLLVDHATVDDAVRSLGGDPSEPASLRRTSLGAAGGDAGAE